MEEDVPRALTEPELRLIKAEIMGRTVHLGQRVFGKKAWQVVQAILTEVDNTAGPDFDYAVQFTEQVAEEFYCGDQVVSTTLRGICLMYGRPFVLPRLLWERELVRVRASQWYATRRIRQIQEKYPWAVPNIPTGANGAPLSLDALDRPLRIGRPRKADPNLSPEEVQSLINYHEASYWRFRYWCEELIAMRPDEWAEMMSIRYFKGGKGRIARKTDITKRDRIQVDFVPAAGALRSSNR